MRRESGEEVMQQRSVEPAQAPSDDNGWPKHAPAAAGADGHRGQTDLEEYDEGEHLYGQCTMDCQLGPAVSHAQGLGEEVTDEPDDEPPDLRFDVPRNAFHWCEDVI